MSPGCDLWCATADFAHAYKHVPILDDQKEFATIILAGPDGNVKAATLRTQPFGSRRAPKNWPRCTLFLKWVMANLFGVVVAVYVDDVFIIEPEETISSASECFKGACKILGFQLEISKEQAPTKTPSLLGADLSIMSKWITARLPERKRKDLINELNQTLQNGTLTPAQAAKLRGKLGFSQSLMFGRLGRAILAPLSTRQYSKNPGRAHPLNAELKECINWWIPALSNATPAKRF